MELLQLKYFYESAKNESFSRTAERYMVPTTSVSASVRRLERELGCDLFVRTPNKILLNESGKRLMSALATAFCEIDTAVADLNAGEDERKIKILVRAIRSNVTDYIIEYNQRHPRIVFNTVFDFSEADYEKYDVIIDEKCDRYPSFVGFELLNMKIRMKIAGGKNLPRRKLSLADLAAEPFISWGESSNMHKVLTRACERAGFYPNIVVQTNDKECYERLLRAGVGIGLGRETPEHDFPGLTYLELSDFDETYTVQCYYKQDHYFGNIKSFIDFLKTKIG